MAPNLSLEKGIIGVCDPKFSRKDKGPSKSWADGFSVERRL